MNMKQTEQHALEIGQGSLLALVRTMIGGSRGREDDEHPLPPGPWDPVIRIALERVAVFGPQPEPWRVFGPSPEPWRTRELVFGPPPDPWKLALGGLLARHPEIFDVLGGRHSFGEEAALNPQPLPPRFAFLLAVAQTVTNRAELLQEIADATSHQGEKQGIIIVGGLTSRFSDDWCATGFKLRWPFPGPRPHWFANELAGIDLIVMATQFEQSAKETFNPDLRQNLANASAKFVKAGLAKMQ
jgi:hypothetical protein